MDAVSSCERERCDDYRSQYSDFSNQMPVLYEAEMACFQWTPSIFGVRADFFSAGKPSACALAFRRRERFEPKRCGSSLASAASCSDARGIELLDPEPAASPGSSSADLIVPAYVKSDQAALVGFVRQYMSFLRPTTPNHGQGRSKAAQQALQSALPRNFEHRRWFVHLFVE